MFKRILLASVFTLITSTLVQAATVTAVFDPTPLNSQASGPNEDPNSVAMVTVIDTPSGGIEIKISGTGASDGVGSIYFKGLSASLFQPAFAVFDAPSNNSYVSNIGGPGVVFTLDPLGALYRGSSTTLSDTPSGALTTADFLGIEIGMITVAASAPQSFGWLFQGQFVSDVTPVPLPAGLPLIVLGLGAIGLAGRKSRWTV